MPRQNPLINLGLNLLLRHYLQKEESATKRESSVPELSEIPSIIELQKKQGAVVTILGKRESGKTVCAYRIAQIIGRPTYSVSPEQSPPQGVEELKLEQLETLPPPFSTLLLDDLPAYMGSRDYQDAFVQTVEKIIPVVRHKRKLILIFISQTSAQADKWVMDCDLVIMKPMGWLYPEVERPAVKKLADKVMPIFRQMTESQQKKHCFIFSDAYSGLARIDIQ